MKKIVYAMLTAVALSGMRAEAQIMPTTPELIMPNMAASVVREPIKTSSYSYSEVAFSLGTSYIQADLNVFSFNGGNMVKAGIGWVRYHTGDSVIADNGFIEVPSSKMHLNVGLLQDADLNVWVIAAYYNTITSTPQYDLYKWNPAGLSATPDYTVPIPHISFPSPTSPVPCMRVSMDCFGLRRAVIVWNIEPFGAGIFDGGMFVRGIQTGSDAPFELSSSKTLLVTETDGSLLGAADVALARNGNHVRIAYMDRSPAYLPNKPVYVRSVGFNALMTAPSLEIALPGIDVPDGILATAVYNEPQVNHIHIDCPDEDYGDDAWSMVYLRSPNHVFQVTKRSELSPLNQDEISFPGLEIGDNCNPVIAYSYQAHYINVGWYSSQARRYVATRRNLEGTANIAGGVYFVLNNEDADLPCGLTSRLTFSRNTGYKPGQFMAYPIQEEGTMWGDMRSKTSPWMPGPWDPYKPFSAVREFGNGTGMSINPNPITDGAYLSIHKYNGELLEVELYDITGKLLHSMKNRNLDQINNQLGDKLNDLTPGNYYLKVADSEKVTPISFSKL